MFPRPLNTRTARDVHRRRMKFKIKHMKGPINGPVMIRMSEGDVSCECSFRLSPWLAFSS